MYRTLIVEDDPRAAETLRAHLERYAAERGTSFSVEILPSALEFLEGRHPADLVFMVKPVTYEDFALRMGRAMRVMERNAGGTVRIATSEGLRVVAEKDVIYVEIFRHDLCWHVTGSAQPLHARGTLTKVAEELGPERFCRVSASHLINMGQLALIRPGSVVMSDGTEVVISRRRRREVLETLTRYLGGSI